MMKLAGISQRIMNRPINIIELKEKELPKYHQPKMGDNFQSGDLLHLVENEYVVVSKESNLLKHTITKYNKVYRKNGKR